MVFMEIGLLIHQNNNNLLQLGAVFFLGLWLFFPFHSNNHINFYNILYNFLPTADHLFTKGIIFANGSLNSESHTLREERR